MKRTTRSTATGGDTMRSLLVILAIGIGFPVSGCTWPPSPSPSQDGDIIELPDDGPQGVLADDGDVIVLSGDLSEVDPGDFLVSTANGGFLRTADNVAVNPDGTLSISTSPTTIAEAARDGDFIFTDDGSASKAGDREKEYDVFRVSADLNDTLYDVNGALITTSGHFNLDVIIDLDMQVRDARMRYFRAAIGGTVDIDVSASIDLLDRSSISGDVSLLREPFRKYIYGQIGPLPVVIEITADLFAGTNTTSSGSAHLDGGVSGTSVIRCGVEYAAESSPQWSRIGEQGFEFGYEGPNWCVEGQWSTEVYVRPVIEIRLYRVLAGQFDLVPSLNYTAEGFACGEGASVSAGRYEWELGAGLAGHAKVFVDILDNWMIESPYMTIFDRNWVLARGSAGFEADDSDGDGVPDDEDGCPNDPNKTSPGNCGCGQPERPGCGDSACDEPAGQQCAIDYEAENNLALIEHGPGACENTGSEPGPSLEFFDVECPRMVAPGQEMTFTIEWNRCSDCNPNAVIYTSLIGDWAPEDPLYVSNAYFTSCDETAVDSITFRAPTQPGLYRIRWMLCFAFDAMRSFCGEDYTGDAWDPGTCPYVEVEFAVCE